MNLYRSTCTSKLKLSTVLSYALSLLPFLLHCLSLSFFMWIHRGKLETCYSTTEANPEAQSYQGAIVFRNLHFVPLPGFILSLNWLILLFVHASHMWVLQCVNINLDCYLNVLVCAMTIKEFLSMLFPRKISLLQSTSETQMSSPAWGTASNCRDNTTILMWTTWVFDYFFSCHLILYELLFSPI